jgi:hypothetical protein
LPIKKESAVQGTGVTAMQKDLELKGMVARRLLPAALSSVREEQGFILEIMSAKGKDDTLFALVDGSVAFERLGKSKKLVNVYPAE